MPRRPLHPLVFLSCAAWVGCIDSSGLVREAGVGTDRDAATPRSDGAPADAAVDGMSWPADLAPPDAKPADAASPADGATDGAVIAGDAAADTAVGISVDAAEATDLPVPVLEDAAAPDEPLAPDAGPADAAWSSDVALPWPAETVIFHDDFESGGTSRWTASMGAVSVDATCAIAGGRGLHISGVPPTSVWFDLPWPHAHVKVSAKVDLSLFVPASAQGADPLVVLRTDSIPDVADVADIAFALQAPLLADVVHADIVRPQGSRQIQNDRGLAPGPHTVELEWKGSSQLGEPDGFIVLRVDGQTGILEPSRADGEVTIATAVTRLALGFTGLGGVGDVCIDDVLVTDVP